MLNNQRGIALFEVIPLLVIFVLLLNFLIGFFGVIHSGILNSIAARNYAFETFRNRANLSYFRDVPMADADLAIGFLETKGFRYHGIVGENPPANVWFATKRSIKFSEHDAQSNDAREVHTQKVSKIAAGVRVSESAPEITKEDFTKVWVRTVYGICLNKACGE